MRPLPFLALCALSGHLLAQRSHTRTLHAALTRVHRQSEDRMRALRLTGEFTRRLRSDLNAAQRSEQLARQELTTTRANLKVTEQALVETSREYQHLLQSRPKPAPKPGAGGFRSWGQVLGLDSLGTGERVREGMTFAQMVATPLDPQGGET